MPRLRLKTPKQKSLAEVQSSEELRIPTHTIDLSLPPSQRYHRVAIDFLPHLASLTALFDEIVPSSAVRGLARLLLRRLHSKEQTEELHGIHLVTGVGMHLLVAFNVLLDLFMGCTSGGVKLSSEDKMLHFRTLDWGMDPLRKVIVQLEYVRDRVKVASAVTYVGYVGVLTGVRKGLSMSLNFRPIHNATTWRANVRFYLHHALVLFGFRPAISSILRTILIPRDVSQSVPTLDAVLRELPSTPTTAAYLIFCNGEQSVILEKDYNTAVMRSAPDFIVVTNHDRAQEPGFSGWRPNQVESTQAWGLVEVLDKMDIHDLVAESTIRKGCITKLWECSAQSGKSRKSTRADRNAITQNKVCGWLNTYPITNESTHYALLMDPKAGKIVWGKHYPDPQALWDQTDDQDQVT